MSEIFKKIDFTIFDLPNNDYIYQVSNYGRIRKKTKTGYKYLGCACTNKKYPFIKYLKKEISIKHIVVAAFYDKDYKKYKITFKDNDINNNNIDNLQLELINKYKKVSQKYIDILNKQYENKKIHKIILSIAYRKDFQQTPFISYEDLPNEFYLYLREHIIELELKPRKYKNIEHFIWLKAYDLISRLTRNRIRYQNKIIYSVDAIKYKSSKRGYNTNYDYLISNDKKAFI